MPDLTPAEARERLAKHWAPDRHYNRQKIGAPGVWQRIYEPKLADR